MKTEYHRVASAYTVLPKGDPLFSEMATTVRMDDEGGETGGIPSVRVGHRALMSRPKTHNPQQGHRRTNPIMATKGAQAQGITQQNVVKAQKGQQAKADARRARKTQSRAQKPTESVEKAPITGESALHALFSRVRKIVKENHVSRNPADILAHSQELRKSVALHGIDATIERINSALDASGISGEQKVAFRRNALRAYL